MRSWLRHLFVPHRSNRHRPKLLHPDGLALVAVLIVAIHISLALVLHFPIFPSVLGDQSPISAQEVMRITNQRRVDAGLSELSWNNELAAAAQLKAQDMMNRSYWSHTTPEGREPWDFIDQVGYKYAIAGENLARNFSSTDLMIATWMASPTHRANIIHDSYQDTGIAVVEGTMDGHDTTLVVQLFGTPESAAVAAVPDRAFATTKVLVESSSTAPVLGAQLQLTPVHFYRAGSLTVLAILAGVLILDLQHSTSSKSKRRYGKSLAHLTLLLAVILTVVLAEGGNLL